MQATIPAEQGEAFRVIPGRAAAGLVVVCDHARNALPTEYGTLGLAPGELERHIAYDIGAEAMTEVLAAELDLPAVLTRYSRLLIDPNRGADDPTLVMRISDGAVVPGNRALDAAERQRRVQRFYTPYHVAIDRVIDGCLAAGVAPAIVAVHTFTDRWKGAPRPWHVGILWAHDPRLAVPLIDALGAEGDLVVGENEPYAGSLEGDTVWQHALKRGLAHALIEVRQDLVRDAAGQRAWGERLSRILARLMADPVVSGPLREVKADLV